MDHLQLTTFGQRHNWLAWPILHANPALAATPKSLSFYLKFFFGFSNFLFYFKEVHEFSSVSKNDAMHYSHTVSYFSFL